MFSHFLNANIYISPIVDCIYLRGYIQKSLILQYLKIGFQRHKDCHKLFILSHGSRPNVHEISLFLNPETQCIVF